MASSPSSMRERAGDDGFCLQAFLCGVAFAGAAGVVVVANDDDDGSCSSSVVIASSESDAMTSGAGWGRSKDAQTTEVSE